nr:immunoglobulin heavy chain junction region [Macaca mulatta]MOV39207.1 immunoglobulin heavy chain junction region [Macaca mulatta]MOV39288.1 immunoglobulin heavy chain junction region [Macaca mulatta]MOV40083.1 immunoglobulin heavy chain junction region [Macaca mulatta]MOV43181.1 immunoglobulin heavy chain junction region [Macaca mulatta]
CSRGPVEDTGTFTDFDHW